MQLTTDNEAFKQIMKRFDKIEKMMQDLKGPVLSKWVDEGEAIRITGLGKRSLQKKRLDNIFTWSSATGRKIKYLRKDLEDYINENTSRA